MTDTGIEKAALDLLGEALEQPESARDAWLAARSDVAPAVRARVRDLLVADRCVEMSLRTGGAASDAGPAELPERIGAYRITGLIGQGGMGAVYRGERATGDFEHRAAIKVVRPGPMSDTLSERFRHERQVLARLDHPGIARLFDGGETEAGEPYFVMEYVEGRTFKAILGERSFGLDALLAIYGDVCRAVRHAHARLIVHGDIGPANILITPDGEAKLIDFGISRVSRPGETVASGPEAGKTVYTRAYAAPERRAGQPASTAADIYALGAVLADIVGAAGGDAELRAIAARARAEDPEARYSSVEALIADLDRHAGGFPVEAMAGGARYHARKLVGRHRVLSGAIAAGLMGLVVALTVVTALYRQAETARAAEAERFADVRSLAGYLLFDLYDSVADLPRSTPVREEMARRAQAYLDRLRVQRDPPLDLTLEIAEGFRRLGDIQGGPGTANLGDKAAAGAAYAQASALLDATAEAHGEDPAWRLAQARVLLSRARADFYNDFDPQAAAARAREADALLADLERSGEVHAWYAIARSAVGEYALFADDPQAALSALSEAEAAFATLSLDGLPPTLTEEVHVRRAGGFRARAGALLHLDRGEEALEALEAGAALWRRIRAEAPDRRRFLRSNAVHLLDQANMLGDVGRVDSALTAYRQATELAGRSAGADPADEAARFTLEAIQAAHAHYLGRLGRRSEALAILDPILSARQALADAAPDDAKRRMDVLSMLRPYGEIHAAAGDRAAACAAYAEARAAFDAFDRDVGMNDELRNNEYQFLLDRIAGC